LSMAIQLWKKEKQQYDRLGYAVFKNILDEELIRECRGGMWIGCSASILIFGLKHYIRSWFRMTRFGFG